MDQAALQRHQRWQSWYGRLLRVVGMLVALSFFGVGNLSVTHAEEPTTAEQGINPYDYLPVANTQFAQVTYRTPVYYSLNAVRSNQPFGRHGGTFSWVSILDSAAVGNQTFYKVRWSWNVTGWINGNALRLATLSKMYGVDMQLYPGVPFGMVYNPLLNVRSQPGVLTPDTLVGTLKLYDVVWILEEQRVGGELWYRIGDSLWVHSAFVRRMKPSPRPEAIGPDERWIEINLTEQTAIAHQGDTPIYGTLVATGRGKYATVTGLFRIWIKLRQAPMAGGTGNDAYDLGDVPWVMYFHQGYGLHGAYWHDNFGAVRSHGCVNFSPFDARWFFDFTTPVVPETERFIRSTEDNPGTYVWVHY